MSRLQLYASAVSVVIPARLRAPAHGGGEDKGYEAAAHVAKLRELKIEPHVARHDALTRTGKRWRGATDADTAASAGYGMSQTRRKMIECIFGWGKQHGTMRRTRHRGLARVAGDFWLNLIGYNLIRIPRLLAC